MQQLPPTLGSIGGDAAPGADHDIDIEGAEIGIAAVAEAVLTASRALVAVAARSLATVDAQVTVPQFRALVVLSSRGPQPVGALAEALAIHPSTATRLCDRLVSKRLVRRAVSRENRRETTISLSPAGRDLVDRVTNIRRNEIAAIVARVPVQTRAAMVTALTAFAEAAGEPPINTWMLGWT
ncbi:MAG: transcriptional regulator, MarR family [Acidimicrobiales bacterium]|nr:transcriptional regulator, MarR family [Acidimicrobiales bacterium]